MKECEVALLNREGPGPGYYNSAKAELKTLAGTEKDKFSIGLVRPIYHLNACRVLEG